MKNSFMEALADTVILRGYLLRFVWSMSLSDRAHAITGDKHAFFMLLITGTVLVMSRKFNGELSNHAFSGLIGTILQVGVWVPLLREILGFLATVLLLIPWRNKIFICISSAIISFPVLSRGYNPRDFRDAINQLLLKANTFYCTFF